MNQTRNEGGFKYRAFSDKQARVLTWWCKTSPVKDSNGIIADGSIRAGKTLAMGLAFVFWAMESFNGQSFALCGKTIGSLRRNVVVWLKTALAYRGYEVVERRADNMLVIRRGDKTNLFYLFGGRDERSQDLIQGITLAGVLFDEVALMPESFVNQATARCSVEGSKWWFNCNPQGPQHWFRKKWIERCRSLGLLYLHFTMEDNLSLDAAIKERYKRQYHGVFYSRYILGQWVLAQGLIYPNVAGVPVEERKYTEYRVAVDYGIYNPMAFALFGLCGGVWYMVREYYHSGRDTKQPKTDEQYYSDLDAFIGGVPVRMVLVDPSAASFITLIQSRGKYRVTGANNAVIEGISLTLSALENGGVKINECCVRMLAEFGEYRWDEKEQDKPVKMSDHLCDALRYFVMSVYGGGRAQAAGRLG